MTNQVLVVGRIQGEAVKEKDSWFCRLRTQEENGHGSYVISFRIWEDMAAIINERFGEGSVCGVRGYLTEEDGRLVLVTERISFLSVKDDE